jgi:hypothetical protein
MLKNIEGKEVDAFEQEMEHSIAGLEKRCVDVPDDAYSEGQLSLLGYTKEPRRTTRNY